MNKPALIAVVLFVTTSNALAQISSTDRLSPSGVGSIKFGMTLAKAAAAGVPLVADRHGANAQCFLAHPASPAGLSFMVRGGKIVRADMVKPANLRTVDGFKRGDKEGALTGFYAATSAGVSDFPLSDQSDISLVASPEFSAGDNIHRLVYEVTDRDGVFAIHAGWVPRKFHSCSK